MRDSTPIDLLKRMVSINSVNPSLVEGAPGEDEIAQFIAEFMREMGLKTQLEEVKPSRPNVVGILEGSGKGPILLMNGHMDTVGISYMDIDPLNPVVKDGRLYGRGSYDMKAGLAAMLAATKSIIDSGVELYGDLIIAAVCDEEYASIGTERLMENILPDAAIVTEPTELDIVIAHKGFAWIDIETHGVAAHGSMPEEGVDAIVKMGKVLVELENLQNGLLQESEHELVGPPSIHSSIINGGRELSTYPDYCKLRLERRLIPGEERSDVESEIQGILNSISETDPQFKGEFNISFIRGPMQVSLQERICQILSECTEKITGNNPKFVGKPYWLDSEIIWKKGVPVVAFGPSGGGAHSAIEYIDIESVNITTQILEQTIIQFCGSK
jgi:acetylornithine deacetylase